MQAVVEPIISVQVPTELEGKGDSVKNTYIDYMYTVLGAIGSRWGAGSSMWRTCKYSVMHS